MDKGIDFTLSYIMKFIVTKRSELLLRCIQLRCAPEWLCSTIDQHSQSVLGSAYAVAQLGPPSESILREYREEYSRHKTRSFRCSIHHPHKVPTGVPILTSCMSK